MSNCHDVYRGSDDPKLPYFSTAKECIDAVKKYKDYNFWALPDSELVKLAQYYQKTVCESNRHEFTLPELRKAKEHAIREHLQKTELPKTCNYEVSISSNTFSGIGKCNLMTNHGGNHTYVF